MRHAVDPIEHLRVDRAHVFVHELDAIEQMCQRRAAPVEPVEHAHLVARLEQTLAQDDADIAGSAGDQDLHGRDHFRIGADGTCALTGRAGT